MAFCNFCQSETKQLRCVCGKVSYCNKQCQSKDWRNHKQSCPPFRVKEVAGKGRGLFATRKIKPGQTILEELPIFVYGNGGKNIRFATADRTDKIFSLLSLHDPLENLKNLDSNKVEELISNNPSRWLSRYRILKQDEMDKEEKTMCMDVSCM